MATAARIFIQGDGATPLSSGASSIESVNGHTPPGFEDCIKAYDTSLSVSQGSSSSDDDTSSGKRVITPFEFSKPRDKSSPLLVNSYEDAKPFSKVVVSYFRLNAEGHIDPFLTLELQNALVQEIQFIYENIYEAAKEAKQNDQDQLKGAYERIRFTYSGIRHLHKTAGNGGEINWVAAGAGA